MRSAKTAEQFAPDGATEFLIARTELTTGQ